MASNLHYHIDDRVSLLEENARGIYDTPGTYSAQWSPPPNHGDLGSPEYEMRTRMGQPVMRNDSETSTPSMGGYFPKQPHVQTSQYDPLSKVETGYSTTTPVLYEESSGRQLRHILIGSSFRWGITVALCTAYILVTILWNNKGPVDENSKKIYNTITTGISIALGLNIASAFKDMALNMRWPILSHQKRSLKELDLILHSDSMQSLAKLAITSKGPWVIVLSIFWLLINIAAQVGIAACSLTYGFETDFDAVLFTKGPVLVANMTRFFPIGSNGTINSNAMFETFNEDFTAHTFGGLPYKVWPIDLMPNVGDIYKDSNADFWYDTTNNYFTVLFLDNPVDLGVASTFSAYSSRHINVSTVCEAHRVIANGNMQDFQTMGTNITVGDGIGTITVADEVLSNATTYFTFGNNVCESGTRCTTVQVLEASEDDPWYYRCNTTLTPTQDDPYNVSFVDDRMAQIASSSIAQIGWTDAGYHSSQVYPLQSLFGQPMHGDTNFMAYGIGSYAMGSIWGAHNYNPYLTFNGSVPTSGQKFSLNHNISFYLVLGALMGSQFFFCVVVAFAANRVTVGPEKHLGMGLLLRPISNHLESVSGGKEDRAYRHATKHTHVIYEKGPNGKWGLSLT